MTEESALEFFHAFAEDDCQSWHAAFTERDRSKLREAEMAIQRRYAPGITLNFGRPRRAKDDFFDGRGREKAERLRMRVLYALATDTDKAVLYTDGGRPPDGTTASARLTAVDTDKGVKIVQVATLCTYCQPGDATCSECGGTGWRCPSKPKKSVTFPHPGFSSRHLAPKKWRHTVFSEWNSRHRADGHGLMAGERMTEDSARAFFEAFADDDEAAWKAAFAERDRSAFREATRSVQRRYAPGAILNFNRPRRPKDDYFDGEGKQNLAKLRRRTLYALAIDDSHAVFYTDYGTPPDGTSGAQRLVAADTDNGLRIVQIAMVCPYCQPGEAGCSDCGGTGWKVQQELQPVGDLPAPTLITPPPRDRDVEAYRAQGMDG